MVGNAGIFFIAIKKTTIKGIRATGVILKELFKVSVNNSIVASSTSEDTPRPSTINNIKAIINEGVVVQTICFICSNNSEPVTAGAKFVVSESGDILSPK